MSVISAKMVKELRDRTGAPMMDCKAALKVANGDVEQALIEMRKAGQAKADKKSSRTAADGVIVIKISQNQSTAIILEVNCETDFVGRDETFTAFANQVAELMLSVGSADLSVISEATYPDSDVSVDETRKALIAKIGENISLRRATLISSDHAIGAYTHNGRIGALVALENADAELARDLAMHVSASNPMVMFPEDVPESEIEKERAVAQALAERDGKPAEIAEKQIEGRLRKYRSEVSLMGQAFVKDPSQKIAALLKSKGNSVTEYARFKVGEGIEKAETDFAKEVMEQVKGSA